MKTVFFVHRYYPVKGGAERYIKKSAEFCASQKNEVTVHTTNADNLQSFICPNAQKLAVGEETINGVKVVRHAIKYPFLRRYWGNLLYRLPFHESRLKGYFHPATPIVPSMKKIILDSDIIVASAIPYDYINLTALFLSKKHNIPFVFVPFLHLGNLDDPNDPVRCFYTQKYQLNLIRQADGVIVQTNIEKNFLISSGIDEKNIVKIGQGIDTSYFEKKDPHILRKKLNIPDDAFVIGHLGNLSFEKGSIDLLEAFKDLSREKKNIYLVYAGSSMKSYEEFAQSGAIPNNFRNLGIINNNTRNEFFSAIDCFCLPSRVESFGVVFLESWWFEKPVIAYDAGGVPDIISDSIDGVLAKTGDKKELIQKIIFLYNNRELNYEYGKAGKDKVKKNYTLDKINEKTYSFLKTMCNPARVKK